MLKAELGERIDLMNERAAVESFILKGWDVANELELRKTIGEIFETALKEWSHAIGRYSNLLDFAHEWCQERKDPKRLKDGGNEDLSKYVWLFAF